MTSGTMRYAAVLLLGLAACGPGGCGGCFQAPIGPLPESERVYEGLQIRITPEGFAAGAGNMATALTAIAPTYVYFTIPATPVQAGDFDGTLCPSGCWVYSSLDDAQVDREPPDKLLLKSDFEIRTTATFSGTPQCSITFELHPTASVELQVTREEPSNHLAVKVGAVRVPIAPADVAITNSTCGQVDLAPIRDAIASMSSALEQELHNRVQGPARQQFCLECDDYIDGCPAGSTCNSSSNFCEWPAGACVAEPLGLFGVIDLQQVARGNYRDPAGLEFHMIASQTGDVSTDTIIDPTTGANFRFYGGVRAPSITPDCVPEGLPPIGMSERVDLDAEAQRLASITPALENGYHLGFVLTESVMSRILQGGWAGGAFCVQATPEISSLLSAESLAAVLPSIATVADPDAPAVLQLRLKEPPEATAGAGEYGLDRDGKRVLLKPLVTADLKGLELSVYTVVEGRYVRVLGLLANSRLPLGVEQVPNATGKPTLLPVLGSLETLAENIEVTHNELLAEDEETVRAGVRAMLTLAQPVVESTLASFALPSVDGLQLELLGAHGVNPGGEPDDYRAVGVFLNVTRGARSTMPVRTDVKLLELIDPAPGAAPVVAKVHVSGSGDGPLEVQYRVDGGLWSAFQSAGELVIDHPRLALRGTHEVELRARQQGAWATLDPTSERLVLEVKRPRPAVELKTRELGPELLEPEPPTPHESSSGCGTPGAVVPLLAPLLLAVGLRRRRG